MKKYSKEYFLSLALILFVFGSIIMHNIDEQKKKQTLLNKPVTTENQKL